MKERSYKDITKDFEIINNYISKYKLSKELTNSINRKVNQIGQVFNDLGKLKVVGNYSNELVFNFQDEIIIEAMVVKFVSFKNFQKYEGLIETPVNSREIDPIANLRATVFNKLKAKLDSTNFEIKKFDKSGEKVQVNWIEGDKKISLILNFGIDSKQIYQIVHSHGNYQLDFEIQFASEYKVLNNILMKKLDFLFLSFYLYTDYKVTPTDIKNLKNLIIGDLQDQLHKNDYMREWISLVFKKFLRNEVYVDSLFKNQDFYFKNSKIFNQIFNSFKMNKLNYVFNMTYNNLKDFVNYYTEFAKSFLKKYNSKEFNDLPVIYHLYEFNPYLTSKGLNKNILVRNWQRLNEEANLKLTKKYIYPDNKDIGTFVLFSIFYQVKIE